MPFQRGRMVNQMSRIIQYIKLFFLTWFIKAKQLWKRIWIFIFPQETIEELEDTKYIPADKYDSIFSVEQKTKRVFVSESVWDQIKESVPDSFTLPNPHFIKLFTAMKADSYDRIFHHPPSVPLLYVDSDVWIKIIENLPKGYLLPTPLFEDVMGPMRSEYYDNIFSKSFGTTKNVVDNRVWERIKKNLPDNYVLPNPSSILRVYPSHDDKFSPISTKSKLEKPH